METNTLIDTFFHGWSNNLEALLPLFTDDIVYKDVALGKEVNGKEQLEGVAGGFFAAFPDIRFARLSLLQSGDRLALEWRASGTHLGPLMSIAATHKKMEFLGVSIMQLRGDKIARVTDYWDLAMLLRQLGQLPS